MRSGRVDQLRHLQVMVLVLIQNFYNQHLSMKMVWLCLLDLMSSQMIVQIVGSTATLQRETVVIPEHWTSFVVVLHMAMFRQNCTMQHLQRHLTVRMQLWCSITTQARHLQQLAQIHQELFQHISIQHLDY